MEYIKYILLVMLVVAFMFSTAPSSAMAACNCVDMSPDKVAETSCHDMGAAKVDSKADDEKQASKCMECGCGHCTVSSPISLNQPNTVTDFTIGKTGHPFYSDIVISLITYGIDNPPKRIS